MVQKNKGTTNRIFKINFLVLGFLFSLCGCDFGTQIDYTYQSSATVSLAKSITVTWLREGECHVYFEVDSIDYDQLEFRFFGDESPLLSFNRCTYSYFYDETGEFIVDSSLYCYTGLIWRKMMLELLKMIPLKSR